MRYARATIHRPICDEAFSVAKKLLGRFKASNPTWTKRPARHRRRKARRAQIRSLFLAELRSLSALVAVHGFWASSRSRPTTIRLGNSEKLRLRPRSVDLVLTSPPYCTRIDYAVATAIELAVLGFSDGDFDALRRSLMGTSTVVADEPPRDRRWGETCNRFLNRLHKHGSKASQTYYFKNHLQYFASLYSSIGEIARVLKHRGQCIIVVQDSYYKEIRNDVPTVVSEMARSHGLTLSRKVNFVSLRSMAGVNKNARKYLKTRKTSESVLCFTKI